MLSMQGWVIFGVDGSKDGLSKKRVQGMFQADLDINEQALVWPMVTRLEFAEILQYHLFFPFLKCVNQVRQV